VCACNTARPLYLEPNMFCFLVVNALMRVRKERLLARGLWFFSVNFILPLGVYEFCNMFW